MEKHLQFHTESQVIFINNITLRETLCVAHIWTGTIISSRSLCSLWLHSNTQTLQLFRVQCGAVIGQMREMNLHKTVTFDSRVSLPRKENKVSVTRAKETDAGSLMNQPSISSHFVSFAFQTLKYSHAMNSFKLLPCNEVNIIYEVK